MVCIYKMRSSVYFWSWSTNRTLKGTGPYAIPSRPTIGGGSSPSGGRILYLYTIAVKNKKSSFLASASPIQTLLPIIDRKDTYFIGTLPLYFAVSECFLISKLAIFQLSKDESKLLFCEIMQALY